MQAVRPDDEIELPLATGFQLHRDVAVPFIECDDLVAEDRFRAKPDAVSNSSCESASRPMVT